MLPIKKWYFAFNEHAADHLKAHIQLAVLSCKSTLDLEMNCLYSGDFHPLLTWLEKKGVKVTSHRLTFLDQMRKSLELHIPREHQFNFKVATGAYLRTDLPYLEDDAYVLYTDVDVLFLRDIDFSGLTAPNYFSCAEEIAITPAGPQFFSKSFNTGVMVMNTASMRKLHSEFLMFLQERNYDFNAYDQGALNEFYKDKWDKLSRDMNWRPFMGINRSATIVHFHGPKLSHVAGRKRNGFRNNDIFDQLYNLNPKAYEYYCDLISTQYPEIWQSVNSD